MIITKNFVLFVNVTGEQNFIPERPETAKVIFLTVVGKPAKLVRKNEDVPIWS